MSFNLPPLGAVASAAPLSPAPPPARTAAHETAPVGPAAAAPAGAAPGSPAYRTAPGAPPPMPADLREQVEAAARRYRELSEQERHLRFTPDPMHNRVIVEVTDGQGRVLRTIPPASALEIAAGARLD